MNFQDGPIKLYDPKHGLDHCIGIAYKQATPLITLMKCNYGDHNQAWRFKYYTQAYDRLVTDLVIPYTGQDRDILEYYEHYGKFITQYNMNKHTTQDKTEQQML